MSEPIEQLWRMTVKSLVIPASFLIVSLLVSGCAERLAPAPVLPTATPPAKVAANLAAPALARGQQVFLDKQCVACHGQAAEGGIGGALAGTKVPFDHFLDVVRTALPPKPAFSEAELTTQDVYNVYGWLQALKPAGAKAAAPELPAGKVLGMTVWTEGKCDTCHGAFGQGSAKGPTLVGLTFPFEMERAKMRQTADKIPEHAPEQMNDDLFRRLYQWLQAGANPGDGC